MEVVLEERVHERGHCRALSDYDQHPKKEQSYEHRQEPPALVAPEEAEQLRDNTGI
jgi:hypothetical protein